MTKPYSKPVNVHVPTIMLGLRDLHLMTGESMREVADLLDTSPQQWHQWLRKVAAEGATTARLSRRVRNNLAGLLGLSIFDLRDGLEMTRQTPAYVKWAAKEMATRGAKERADQFRRSRLPLAEARHRQYAQAKPEVRRARNPGRYRLTRIKQRLDAVLTAAKQAQRRFQEARKRGDDAAAAQALRHLDALLIAVHRLDCESPGDSGWRITPAVKPFLEIYRTWQANSSEYTWQEVHDEQDSP
jgi:hypothetical protein